MIPIKRLIAGLVHSQGGRQHFALNGAELAWTTTHVNVGSKHNVQLLHVP